jgi:hypothetical protein
MTNNVWLISLCTADALWSYAVCILHVALAAVCSFALCGENLAQKNQIESPYQPGGGTRSREPLFFFARPPERRFQFPDGKGRRKWASPSQPVEKHGRQLIRHSKQIECPCCRPLKSHLLFSIMRR